MFIKCHIVPTLVLGLRSITYREIHLLYLKAGLCRRIQPYKSFTWTEFPCLNCFLREKAASKVTKFSINSLNVCRAVIFL